MDINEEIEQALREAGLTCFQALRLALELVEQSGAQCLRGNQRMKLCRQVIRLGAEQQRAAAQTVDFAQAAQSALAERRHRRPRTVAEFSSVCRRVLRCCPLWSSRHINTLDAAACADVLHSVFPSARQRQKGRAILHGVFAHAVRQHWCEANPMESVRLPAPEEREIEPLSVPRLQRLLKLASTPPHCACMAPLCGVRPAELVRLNWADVDWEEKVLVLRPRHSKTGGCRHIPLRPALLAWLKAAGAPGEGPLCPPNWERRWKRLREAAGLIPWQQDVLRHTFASYHAKFFRDFALLQSEMGHRSAALLHTRYLSMKGLTADGARTFWAVGGLWSS